MVSASSPMACARFSTPTGPPPNLSITASSSLRSITSRPRTSTSRMASAAAPRVGGGRVRPLLGGPAVGGEPHRAQRPLELLFLGGGGGRRDQTIAFDG